MSKPVIVNKSTKEANLRILLMVALGAELQSRGVDVTIITKGIVFGDVGKLSEVMLNDSNYGWVGLMPGGRTFDLVRKTIREQFPKIIKLDISKVTTANYDAWVANAAKKLFGGNHYVPLPQVVEPV